MSLRYYFSRANHIQTLNAQSQMLESLAAMHGGNIYTTKSDALPVLGNGNYSY
jgi:hypothetical protein